MIVELVYDDVPPSLNRIGTRGTHWPVTKAKKAWQSICEALLMCSAAPRHAKAVRASAVLRFPVSRIRDEGNFRAILEKALGDALVNGGWLPNDHPEHYTFGALTFATERGPEQTRVTLDITL